MLFWPTSTAVLLAVQLTIKRVLSFYNTSLGFRLAPGHSWLTGLVWLVASGPV